jgi:hypothetical protein
MNKPFSTSHSIDMNTLGTPGWDGFCEFKPQEKLPKGFHWVLTGFEQCGGTAVQHWEAWPIPLVPNLSASWRAS